jgi:hypothetical protein
MTDFSARSILSLNAAVAERISERVSWKSNSPAGEALQ